MQITIGTCPGTDGAMTIQKRAYCKPPVMIIVDHWMSLSPYKKAAGTLLFGSKIVFVLFF